MQAVQEPLLETEASEEAFDALEGFRLKNLELPNFVLPHWDEVEKTCVRGDKSFGEVTISLQYPTPGQRVLLATQPRPSRDWLHLYSTEWNRMKVHIYRGTIDGRGYFCTRKKPQGNYSEFDSRVSGYTYNGQRHEREEQTWQIVNAILVLHQFRDEVFAAWDKKLRWLSKKDPAATRALERAFEPFENDIFSKLITARSAAETVEDAFFSVHRRFEGDMSQALSAEVRRLSDGDKAAMQALEVFNRDFRTLERGVVSDMIVGSIATQVFRKFFDPLIPHMVLAELTD